MDASRVRTAEAPGAADSALRQRGARKKRQQQQRQAARDERALLERSAEVVPPHAAETTAGSEAGWSTVGLISSTGLAADVACAAGTGPCPAPPSGAPPPPPPPPSPSQPPTQHSSILDAVPDLLNPAAAAHVAKQAERAPASDKPFSVTIVPGAGGAAPALSGQRKGNAWRARRAIMLQQQQQAEDNGAATSAAALLVAASKQEQERVLNSTGERLRVAFALKR